MSEHSEYLNCIFKLHKDLCELKQAPTIGYEKIRKLLFNNDFKRGQNDNTLFIKNKDAKNLA